MLLTLVLSSELDLGRDATSCHVRTCLWGAAIQWGSVWFRVGNGGGGGNGALSGGLQGRVRCHLLGS